MPEPCSKETEIQKILTAIYGTETAMGMKTQLALIAQKIDALPSPGQLKFYAFTGGGLTLLVALVGLVVLKALGVA
jgi:hypothetical protein